MDEKNRDQRVLQRVESFGRPSESVRRSQDHRNGLKTLGMTSVQDMLVQEQSFEQDYDEEQDAVEDTLDQANLGPQQEPRIEGEPAGLKTRPAFSKQRRKQTNVNITSTLSTRGRTQRGPMVASSDGQQNSLSHTIMHSQSNTHDFLSNGKERARTSAAHQEIQETDERSLITHQQPSGPADDETAE